jgi:hypothetical protein
MVLSWTTTILLALLGLGTWLLIRWGGGWCPAGRTLLAHTCACTLTLCCTSLHSYATNKVKGKLRKAGVSLTYNSLSLRSITGVQLQLASVSWACSGGSVSLLLNHLQQVHTQIHTYTRLAALC